MIFIYNYRKVPSISKDLEPLSEYIKKYNKVLVADLDIFLYISRSATRTLLYKEI